MKTILLLAQSILLLLLLFVSTASALTVPEKLVYDVSWTGIKAGSAVQEVAFQGDDLHIVNTIRTSGLVSTVLSVDEKTESVIPSQSPASLPKFFRENIKDGKRHTRKEASFDFSSLYVHTKDLLKQTEKRDPISNRTYDSLSSIYFIRSGQLTPGQSIHFELYDFKHLWNAEVQVVKREKIRTPLGKFETLKVTSQLTSNGVPARVGNMVVWLTDDVRRIPVRITVALKVGEITLTLVGGSYWS